MVGDVHIFADDRTGETNVVSRTSVGGWQYVCDEDGRPVDLRPEVRRSRATADEVLHGFARSVWIFESWWRRPL